MCVVLPFCSEFGAFRKVAPTVMLGVLWLQPFRDNFLKMLWKKKTALLVSLTQVIVLLFQTETLAPTVHMPECPWGKQSSLSGCRWHKRLWECESVTWKWFKLLSLYHMLVVIYQHVISLSHFFFPLLFGFNGGFKLQELSCIHHGFKYVEPFYIFFSIAFKVKVAALFFHFPSLCLHLYFITHPQASMCQGYLWLHFSCRVHVSV